LLGSIEVAETAKRMRELISFGKFEEAYDLGKDPLSDAASYTAVMAALKELANELRSYCMSMAAKKMDAGRVYCSREELLRKVCKLIGQDVYGNRLAI
jgi:hypothetical protein